MFVAKIFEADSLEEAAFLYGEYLKWNSRMKPVIVNAVLDPHRTKASILVTFEEKQAASDMYDMG